MPSETPIKYLKLLNIPLQLPGHKWHHRETMQKHSLTDTYPYMAPTPHFQSLPNYTLVKIIHSANIPFHAIQERCLKRLNTLGGLEIGIQRQI